MKAYAWTDETGAHVVHRLFVGPNEEFETGERVGGRLPTAIDNPSIPEILDLVFGPAEKPARAKKEQVDA